MNVLEEQLNTSKEATCFLLNTVEDVKVIKFDDIICWIAESNYTKIHLQDCSKIIASKTLKEFEAILNGPNFFRIHHSYLINLYYIKRIIKTYGCMVELPQNIILDVARTRREELLHKISTI